MAIEGFKELSKQLSRMEQAPAGKLLRRAAFQSTLPAVKRAKALIPVGTPPYESGDPYPTRTYKGNLKTPGFAKRNIARKSKVSRDKTYVRVMIGVKPEAFYAINFIEFGIPGKIPKKPWLEPAFRQSRADIDTRFKQRLKALIDKAAK